MSHKSKSLIDEKDFFNLNMDFSSLDEEGKKQIRTAGNNIRNFVKSDRVFRECLLCNKDEVVNSHLIKRDILKSLAGSKMLHTLASKENSYLSALSEDREKLTIDEAFTFNLICDSCDKIFYYEKKSSKKEKFTKDDIYSIALKARLKNLYDLHEFESILRYKDSNIVESLLLSTIDFDKSLIKSEKAEIIKIYNKKKDFAVILDTFIDFRVSFATEGFVSPLYFPLSGKRILRNFKPRFFKFCKSLSGFYVLIHPSANSKDQWSRVTVFIDKKDLHMLYWFAELSSKYDCNSLEFINSIISSIIDNSCKNFVIAPTINKKALKIARNERIKHQGEIDKTIEWLKILR